MRVESSAKIYFSSNPMSCCCQLQKMPVFLAELVLNRYYFSTSTKMQAPRLKILPVLF